MQGIVGQIGIGDALKNVVAAVVAVPKFLAADAVTHGEY